VTILKVCLAGKRSVIVINWPHRNGAQPGQPCQNAECKKEKEELRVTLHRYVLVIMPMYYTIAISLCERMHFIIIIIIII